MTTASAKTTAPKAPVATKAPAKATTKPAPKATTKAPAKAVGISYKMGEAKYNPRVEHNAEAWAKVQKAITIDGKGKATHTELCAALEKHFSKTDENHHDFIGYMVRRGSIVAAK